MIIDYFKIKDNDILIMINYIKSRQKKKIKIKIM